MLTNHRGLGHNEEQLQILRLRCAPLRMTAREGIRRWCITADAEVTKAAADPSAALRFAQDDSFETEAVE